MAEYGAVLALDPGNETAASALTAVLLPQLTLAAINNAQALWLEGMNAPEDAWDLYSQSVELVSLPGDPRAVMAAARLRALTP